MNKITKGILLAAVLSMSATVINAADDLSGYETDSRNQIVRSASGLCVRTSQWRKEIAVAECDPDLVPKPAAPETAPAPKAATPAATPAAAPAAPAAPPRPTTEKVTIASDVLFDSGKAVIKPEAKFKLNDLVDKLQSINLEVIIAIGHSDGQGSDASAQKMSVRRADAVKTYLVSKGIEPNRVYTEGKGKKQPVAENKTKAGRAMNRRVEIEVVGTRTKK